MPTPKARHGGGGGIGHGGWVHHGLLEQQHRRRWIPRFLKTAAVLVVLAYVFFVNVVTREAVGGDDAGTHHPFSLGALTFAGAGTKTKKKSIAYAISVTADGPYMDGAAVLAHGIRKASEQSKYGMELIAIIHPNVTTSRTALTRAGWK